MGYFNLNREITMISHYCNSNIAAYDPIDHRVDDIDFHRDLKKHKIKKSKNGVCFYTGADQYISSHLYVSKTGKVSKLFIDLVMDFREAFDQFGSLELLYNDQFIKKLSSRQKHVLKENKTKVKFRKLVGNIKINSGFLRVGGTPEHSIKDENKLPKKNQKIIKVETDNQILDNFVLPVRNKIYPVYINSYLAPNEVSAGKVNLKEISEKKIIVIENIEDCYISKITNKMLYLKRSLLT